jgi:hypothetical protein
MQEINVMILKRPFRPTRMDRSMTLVNESNPIRTLKRLINLTRTYARKKLLLQVYKNQEEVEEGIALHKLE